MNFSIDVVISYEMLQTWAWLRQVGQEDGPKDPPAD